MAHISRNRLLRVAQITAHLGAEEVDHLRLCAECRELLRNFTREELSKRRHRKPSESDESVA